MDGVNFNLSLCVFNALGRKCFGFALYLLVKFWPAIFTLHTLSWGFTHPLGDYGTPPPPLPLVLIIRPPSLMIYAAMYLYYNTYIFLEGRGTIVLIFHTFRQLITQHETMFSSRQTAPTSCLSPLCNQFRTTRMHWLITTPGDNESNFCRT